MRRMKVVLALVSLIFLVSGAERAVAGVRLVAVGESESESPGTYVNLIVRGVKVTPIVAHVGDTVRIDMALENGGDPANETIVLKIRANGKVVASKLFTFGWGAEEPNKQYRETLTWNTKGMPPGKYRIEGDAFCSDDDSPADNSLDLKRPLVLLPVGAPMPAGVHGGASATIDPRWIESYAAKFTKGAAADIATGY